MFPPCIQISPNAEGLDACKESLNTREVLSPPIKDIVNLTSLILKRNNFSFNRMHYSQIHGTVIGTHMTPYYANIFMDNLERNLLEYARYKVMIWRRYIDDLFIIWPNEEETLMGFLEEINCFHPTIKFTTAWSKETVMFLDTKVTISEGRLLVMDLYTKNTDAHQHLHSDSCHPYHCKKDIAFIQALRLQSICSRCCDYLLHARELKGYLVE